MATTDKKENSTPKHEIIIPEFQSIIDTANLKGSILIYDLNDDKFYSNNFQWAYKENLPASTFKIVNSIIALETGVVESDSTIFKWDGASRRIKTWEQDLTLRNAFHLSCVPCYQEVARKIGIENMTEYLNKLDYGNMKIDSNNIDLFWLEGQSGISQVQQIGFLKRFYQSKLPISKRTETIMKRMMIIEDNSNYQLSGKTGWSISNEAHNGWFVGYIEAQSKTYFFATNIEPEKRCDMNLFPALRKEITFSALKQLRILK